MQQYRLMSGLVLLLTLISSTGSAQIFGVAGITTSRVNAVQALQRFQQSADRFYASGHYDMALRDYMILSSYSDKYSQYRLATMYYDGKGTTKDLIEAYAWSFVSAESRKPDFVEFHKQVRSQLSEQELVAAREKASDYIARSGLFRAAIDARKMIAREKSECTGSRVGSTCHRVGGSSLSCNGDGNSAPSRRCLTIGSVGLPSVTGIFPSHLRTIERTLDQFIDEYDPGRVELGDLELIDD